MSSAQEEGNAARRLLENPLLKRVIAEIKREVYEQWQQTPSKPEYDEHLRRLHLFGEVVKMFEMGLETRVQAAEVELIQEQQQNRQQT